MTLLVGPLLLGWLAWRGAPAASLGLVAAGALVHGALAARLVRATLGGAGGHAEWVRATSTRPRIRRSRSWAAGWTLMAAGTLLALAG